LRHVIVPKAQHCHAARAQPIVALLIATLLEWFIVLTTIELDREPKLRAIEIQCVRTCGMLSPEAEAVQLARAQLAPHLCFNISRVLPELSGAGRFESRAIKPR
jgi:hypothetical protein